MNYFNYFSEIEDTFIRRRGKNLFISPLDWALIEIWQGREVPLHIVLRGIETVFDNFEKSKKKRSIKSLAFCSEEIEAQYAEWLELQVGKTGETPRDEKSDDDSMFSSETLAAHLEAVSASLEKVKLRVNKGLSETIERVLARLSELKTSIAQAETLEKDLTNLEKMLDESLRENFDKEQMSILTAETQKELHGYKKQMEAEVYRRTFDLLLLKKLRSVTEVPRLSLFFL